MKLDHEQYEILMTALQNYRGELYINSGDTTVLNKVNDLCQAIEDEKKSIDKDQKRIPVTEDMYKVKETKPIILLRLPKYRALNLLGTKYPIQAVHAGPIIDATIQYRLTQINIR